MDKRTTRISFLVFVTLVLLLTGCRRGGTLLVTLPCFEKSLEGHIQKDRVYEAYESGLTDALSKEGEEDGSNTLIRVLFLDKEADIARKLSAMKSEKVRDFIKSRHGNAILYCEIFQPDETIPFAYCKIHAFSAKSGLRAHQFTGLLLHLSTFYSQEYWKAEFKEILGRVKKIL